MSDPGGGGEGRRHSEVALPLQQDLTLTILQIIDASPTPVGARQLKAELVRAGLAPSESTIARRLRTLDRDGLTRKVHRLGRVATALGSEFIAHRMQNAGAPWQPPITVRDGTMLLDLLQARLWIEPAVARDVAGHATAAEIAQLTDLVDAGEHGAQSAVDAIPGVEFHRAVASLVRNPFLSAAQRPVLSTNLQYIDYTLDTVLDAAIGLASGVTSHRAILAAIVERSPEAAEDAMREHLLNLIAGVRRFLESNGDRVLSRILETARIASTRRTLDAGLR